MIVDAFAISLLKANHAENQENKEEEKSYRSGGRVGF